MVYRASSAVVRAGAVRILVSVRNISEFVSILPIGVDVIDFKEPTGALSPTRPSIWQTAAELASDRYGAGDGPALSIAMGELVDDRVLDLADRCPPAVSFAKAGPAGIDDPVQLQTRWDRLRSRLPTTTRLVAVAYADHAAAGCPPPATILQSAISAGLTMLLVDTFDKRDGGLTNHQTADQLRALSGAAAQHNIRLTLAGSLTADAACGLMQNIRPWAVGFRGAACGGDRRNEIDPRRVRQLCELPATNVVAGPPT